MPLSSCEALLAAPLPRCRCRGSFWWTTEAVLAVVLGQTDGVQQACKLGLLCTPQGGRGLTLGAQHSRSIAPLKSKAASPSSVHHLLRTNTSEPQSFFVRSLCGTLPSAQGPIVVCSHRRQAPRCPRLLGPAACSLEPWRTTTKRLAALTRRAAAHGERWRPMSRCCRPISSRHRPGRWTISTAWWRLGRASE